MKPSKVLMLGWEFPPLINGGLGIATYGLTKALSKHTEITLVLPKSSPEVAVSDIELIGLSNVTPESQGKEYQYWEEEYAHFAQLAQVNINLAPYEETYNEKTILQKEVVKTPRSKEIEAPAPTNDFASGNLYHQLDQKVVKYAEYIFQSIHQHADFDLIHAHDWMTFYAGLKLKAHFKKPLVLHVHSLEYDRSGPERKSWIYELEQEAMQQADAVIPVSEYTGKVIVDSYGIDYRKVHPVHNGAEMFEGYKKRKPFKEKMVLFLGRVTHQKGPKYFLEVADKVVKEYPEVRFVLAGTGDQLRHLIEEGAYRHLSDKMHFTGYVDRDQVRDLLATADVYCMPSVSEPFGISALEAAQFDVPMVISQKSGVAEVLKGALVADYRDTDKAATHIISLLKDRKLARRVVEQARIDLHQLTWELAATKVMTVYSKL